MSSFRVNSPPVVHDTIDGETVVIHPVTGIYYSLSGTASWIWDRLARGWDTPSILTALQSAYPQEPESVIHESYEAFLQELAKEQLVVPASQAVTAAEPGSQPDGQPFVAPVLQRYQDMQELLLLDPIHEVEASGWPAHQE
jgi:hypothetical protein